MSVVTALNDVFYVLFYGEGSYLGILLFLCLTIGLIKVWKYSFVFTSLITVFLALNYLSNNLMWHSIIMFFVTFFNIVFGALEMKK